MATPLSTKQQQTSHMLKTGRRGNPFCKDTHDLFATLMVSLELGNNSRFFRTYPNSFTTDDAASNLASLRFSQSNRAVDPNDPARIITTTTTTTFSMSRDIAKGICQHFMDARLIENAADPASQIFKERGIFQITPKGLHVLERFITKNGIASENLVKVFVSQPICMKLIYLERTPTDDDVSVTKNVIDTVFRRFAGGRHPNYVLPQANPNARNTAPQNFVDNPRKPSGFDRSLGVELQDVVERGRGNAPVVFKQVFTAQAAVDWLLDFSTCVCREEAAEIMGHFVRTGYIVLYHDRSRSGDRLVIVEVKSETGSPSAEFRWGQKVYYRITEEGRRIMALAQPAKSLPEKKVPGIGSVDDEQASAFGKSNSQQIMGSALSDAVDRHMLSNQLRDLFLSDLSDPNGWAKEQSSSTHRLRFILEEPMLRGLFREYLRSNYCDENLGFWLDVSEFRRRFATTSSASGGATNRPKTTAASGATSAMEVHQQHLVQAAMQIYHTYLAPMSPNELNIDHNLRADVVNFIQKAQLDNAANGDQPITIKKGSASDPNAEGAGETTGIALRATQVQTLLLHYERIQDHIFRLLATDQVPKFIRTDAFAMLLKEQPEEPKPSKTTQ